MVRRNSFKAWGLAARPKTLTGAVAPVLVALASAYGMYSSLDGMAAILCLLFALLMQIDANLINDYFDCIKGVDSLDRLGPKRACAQGWISLSAMRIGICIVTVLACLSGLPLIAWGGMECILVGMACVVFCFLYTTLFSHIAMGDVLVLMFFGLIPVGYTFLFQSPYDSITEIPLGVWLLAMAQGIMTDCLLLVNNFRDRYTDASVGKTTLVTIIGERTTLAVYACIGIMAPVIAYCGISLISSSQSFWQFLPLALIPIHLHIFRLMYKTNQGHGLNRILGLTAMSIFIFALLTSLALIL